MNAELCEVATKANKNANIVGPIMGNIGNILYVLVAFVGSLLVSLSVPNLTILGWEPLNNAEGVVSLLITTVAFLPISKQFTGNIA